MVDHEPHFAFEVVKMSHAVGWRGAFDTDNGRALVFCSPECMKAARTKRGTYRLRPPRIPSPQPAGITADAPVPDGDEARANPAFSDPPEDR